MGVADRISTNVRDVATFGPTFLLRHLARLKKNGVISVSVPGVGSVFVRAGESDVDVLRQVFASRDYALDFPPELKERSLQHYHEIVASGRKPIIIDAGANIGAAALWFATEFPQAVVVAVEPDPGNAEMLRNNVAGRANCVVLEAAIGAERGHVSLTRPEYSWAVQTQRADEGIPIVTIEDAFEASGGDVPFYVKIDIEGFENDLFASNTDWVSKTFAIAIEPHDWMLPGQMTSRSFQQVLSQHPFELFIRRENLLYVRV